MTNVQLSTEDLSSHLKEQIYFLKTSCDLFDKGNIVEAKRVASTIRILCHDTKTSFSVLGALEIKNSLKFHSSASRRIETDPLNYLGLICIGVSDEESSFEPFLDDTPDKKWNFLNFEDWWNEVVITDNKGNQFTRRSLVLGVANKDGGAHVDPVLDLPLFQLKKENTSGWEHERNGSKSPLLNVDLYSIRQIGHELLKTLDPSYIKNFESKSIFTFTNLQLHPKKSEINFSSVKRNDKCPCNSGLKYKKCHGK